MSAPNMLRAVMFIVAYTVLLCAPPAAAQETIRIGYSPQIHDIALLEIRRDLGVHYKLEYIKFLRYTDTQIALTRGDVDIGSLGYASAVVAAVRDAEPKFVYVAGLARGAINLVCRNDVAVKTWADLKGKIFGVLTGGPAELFFVDALRSHGVLQSDVKTVAFAAPGPPLLQALQTGAIQCTAIFEPLAASAVADGVAYYPPDQSRPSRQRRFPRRTSRIRTGGCGLGRQEHIALLEEPRAVDQRHKCLRRLQSKRYSCWRRSSRA
jgi:ABC-type nitrate/sulfonate/bicarbonate transport system substrate-binding protein